MGEKELYPYRIAQPLDNLRQEIASRRVGNGIRKRNDTKSSRKPGGGQYTGFQGGGKVGTRGTSSNASLESFASNSDDGL